MKDRKLISYPRHARAFLARAREHLEQFDETLEGVHVVYAALELRFGIEARLYDYLTATYKSLGLPRESVTGYVATKLLKDLEQKAPESTRGVVLRITDEQTGRSAPPLVFTPVTRELARMHGELGGFLHYAFFHKTQAWFVPERSEIGKGIHTLLDVRDFLGDVADELQEAVRGTLTTHPTFTELVEESIPGVEDSGSEDPEVEPTSLSQNVGKDQHAPSLSQNVEKSEVTKISGGLNGFVVNYGRVDRLAASVGKFIVNFSAIEMVSLEWLRRTCVDPRELRQIWKRPFAKRVDWILSRLGEAPLSEEQKKDAESLWNTAKEFAKLRNDLAHNPIVGIWEGRPTEGDPDFLGMVLMKTARGTFHQTVDKIRIERLGEINDQLVEFAQRFDPLYRSLGPPLGTEEQAGTEEGSDPES